MRSISVCSAKSEEFEGRFTTSVAMIRHQPPPLANLPAPSWALREPAKLIVIVVLFGEPGCGHGKWCPRSLNHRGIVAVKAGMQTEYRKPL